ncbi:MAG TPA: hypothetical protein VMZ29_13120 [Candidatus Bathyarchaeia archaeon]|nr:hypothetical protein [Candidatus Bathyarchaeia archaeon]
MEKRRGVFRITFLTFSITIAISSLLIILAMSLYPGGNFAGLDIDRFSLVYNGLCDMREVIAINGEPNLASSILVKMGITGISIATTFFFGALCFLFQRKRSTKYLSIIASLFGVAQGPLFAMIILLPASYEVHMTFVVLAPLFQYLAVILYTIVYLFDKGLPKVNVVSFLVLAITTIVFIIIVGIASGVGGNFHYITNRLGTNLFNFISIIIYIIQGLGLFFYLKKTTHMVPIEIT